MLSENAYMTLSKTQTWDMYKQLNEKLEKKDQLIDSYIVLVYYKLFEDKQNDEEKAASVNNQVPSETVRVFFTRLQLWSVP